MLNRRSTIRFRTHYQPNTTVYKKQQQLLWPRKAELKNPLNEGTFRVRVLNRSSSIQFKLGMPHVQPDLAHNHFHYGKPEVLEMFASGSVKDCTRYIQTVILRKCDSDWLQADVSHKAELLRNNYFPLAMKHELSSALHSTGAQIQAQSHTVGTDEINKVQDLINGQRPPSALTAHAVDKGVNADAPPSGNERSLARRRGEGLKWRYHS